MHEKKLLVVGKKHETTLAEGGQLLEPLLMADDDKRAGTYCLQRRRRNRRHAEVRNFADKPGGNGECEGPTFAEDLADLARETSEAAGDDQPRAIRRSSMSATHEVKELPPAGRTGEGRHRP